MNPLFGDRRTTLILVGPALLIYSLIILVPVLWSIGYTFTQGNAISGFTFVGFNNFMELLRDSKVRDSLLFTLKYAAVLTIGQVLLGYLLALSYVFVLRRSSTFVRTLVFFPVVLPTVAVALLFQQLFAIAPQSGMVNSLINTFGGESIDWLGDGASAFVVIVIMDLWRSMGFYGVLLYAGILDIPEDIIESARMDGTNGLSLIRHIVLPLSLPVLVSSIVFSINGTLKVFDTSPLTIYMFQTSFNFGQYGYGSSIAFLLTLVCLAVTLVIIRSNKRDLTKA
jgi:multiple sugar transport system permease protein/raffinose/stachyose/melibiose transport system permease protein